MKRDSLDDQHPEHWDDYSSLQETKHFLIQRYLAGWFNILGSRHRRILYIDTHAGRGRYSTGHSGSPLVALQTLQQHKLVDQILKSCEVRFYFIEIDKFNYDHLRKELTKIHIPRNVFIETIHEDCFEVLRELLESLKSAKKAIAPAFVFIDPYNFSIPGDILRGLMGHEHVELFVNLMWRELDMQLQLAKTKAGIARNMDELFAGPEWKTRITAGTQLLHARQAADLLREKINARWCTPFFMRFGPEAIRYMLLHFTGNDLGRDLMKNTMWKASPSGGYFVRRSYDVDQGLLELQEEPDLSPVEDWVLSVLSKGPKRWKQLNSDFLGESWRDTHLNQTLRKLCREGRLQCQGKRAKSSNPLLSLTTNKD
jgi:three-Cys-motif partner protein